MKELAFLSLEWLTVCSTVLQMPLKHLHWNYIYASYRNYKYGRDGPKNLLTSRKASVPQIHITNLWQEICAYLIHPSSSFSSLASIVQFWTFASSYFLVPYLFRHMVGLPGRVISSLQGLYLYRTTQHKKTRTNIHALSGIRTHNPVYEWSRPAPQTARPLDRIYDTSTDPKNLINIIQTSYLKWTSYSMVTVSLMIFMAKAPPAIMIGWFMGLKTTHLLR
jgi:hypothetical protein